MRAWRNRVFPGSLIGYSSAIYSFFYAMIGQPDPAQLQLAAVRPEYRCGNTLQTIYRRSILEKKNLEFLVGTIPDSACLRNVLEMSHQEIFTSSAKH